MSSDTDQPGAERSAAVPTIDQWAGGRPPLERWLNAFDDRAAGDDRLGPGFGGHVSALRRRAVTTWSCEVMGGPAQEGRRQGTWHQPPSGAAGREPAR